jgi:hypothetical protein
VPVALGVAVVAIVLGIIGMHALTTHSVMTNGDHTATGPMASDPADHVIAGMVGEADAAPAAGPVLGPASGSGHGMGDMVMLCAFMLGAAGVLLLILRALRRSPASWIYVRAVSHAYVQLPRLRADTGPPPAWEFSVIRC